MSQYCKTIVFINSFDNYLENDKSFIEENKIEPIFLENLGHDFGMWQRALQLYDTNNYDHILLANDSCVLLQSLTAFFDWHKTSKPSFAGMINSYENAEHIQSYFTIYNQEAFAVLQKRFKTVGLVKDKRKLIKKYEIGLTQAMQKAKVKTESFFKPDKNQKTNPLFHTIPQLLESGFPFIKKQVFFNQLAAHDQAAFEAQQINLSPSFILPIIQKNCTALQCNWIEIQQDIPQTDIKNCDVQ